MTATARANLQFIRDYVAGLLPAGWRMCHCDVIEFDSSTIATFGAEGPRGEQAGIKREWERGKVPPLETLCAELGDELRKACDAKVVHVFGDVVRFKLDAGARQPTRGTEGSSGYDLYAPEDVYIVPQQVVVIHTGVRIELPRGFEGQVRPRSSLAKRGLWVSLGTIDSDYRGVIGATMINHGRESQKLKAGDRVAQLVIARVEHPEWRQADELTDTVRGTGGFGSTGA